MAGVSSVELDHCSELAMPPGSLFEFTSRFIPAEKLAPLLALYALKQAVSTIVYTPADESVKWAKLKWWSEELAADPGSPSRHPVLRALLHTGARKYIKFNLLQQLISDAIGQIDVVADTDEETMFERFVTTGSTEIQLELALDKAEIDSRNMKFLAAATAAFRMISSFAAKHRSETDRLPLSVLANYKTTAAELKHKLHQHQLEQIIKQLAGDNLDWFSKGLADLEITPGTGSMSKPCSHLQLRWAMEKRRLADIVKEPGEFLDTGKRYGPSDAWFAWRFLKRLK
jgi:phytoene/squalene synthetase